MPHDKPPHNIYDRIFRENAKQIFVALIQHLYQLDVKSFRILNPKFPSTSDNEVDHLYHIIPNKGTEYIVHVEFQAANDPEMLTRMQEYHAKIYKQYKLPVRPLVLNLGDKPFTAPTQLKKDEIFTGYDVIDLFSLSTELLLSFQMPGAVILAILSNYPKEQLDTVLGAIVKKLRTLVKTENEMNRFVNQLFYLSRLRKFEQQTKQKLDEMLIEIDIKEDYFYREGREEGALILSLHHKGESAKAIADKLDISVSQVQSIIEKYASED